MTPERRKEVVAFLRVARETIVANALRDAIHEAADELGRERIVDSDAQDFIDRLNQCIVAAFERGDHGTAAVLLAGVKEFERLRRVEPVDHRFVPGGGAWCAKEGCGRGADEHLEFGLRASLRLVPGGGR